MNRAIATCEVLLLFGLAVLAGGLAFSGRKLMSLSARLCRYTQWRLDGIAHHKDGS